MKRFEFDLAQDRVHHDEKSNSFMESVNKQRYFFGPCKDVRLTDGYRYIDEFALLQGWPDTIDKIAQQNANDDCKKYPKDEQPIKPAEALISGLLLGVLGTTTRLLLYVHLLEPWQSIGFRVCISCLFHHLCQYD